MNLRRVLVDGIAQACAEIDARLGNRPGTAERGCYFWYWPPDPNLGIDVLVALYRDALTFRDTIATTAAA